MASCQELLLDRTLFIRQNRLGWVHLYCSKFNALLIRNSLETEYAIKQNTEMFTTALVSLNTGLECLEFWLKDSLRWNAIKGYNFKTMLPPVSLLAPFDQHFNI